MRGLWKYYVFFLIQVQGLLDSDFKKFSLEFLPDVFQTDHHRKVGLEEIGGI